MVHTTIHTSTPTTVCTTQKKMSKSSDPIYLLYMLKCTHIYLSVWHQHACMQHSLSQILKGTLQSIEHYVCTPNLDFRSCPRNFGWTFACNTRTPPGSKQKLKRWFLSIHLKLYCGWQISHTKPSQINQSFAWRAKNRKDQLVRVWVQGRRHHHHYLEG